MAKATFSLDEAQGKIIGRSRELDLLKHLFKSKNAEFIAIYGRRRVGNYREF